jgi:hypothetical protein
VSTGSRAADDQSHERLRQPGNRTAGGALFPGANRWARHAGAHGAGPHASVGASRHTGAAPLGHRQRRSRRRPHHPRVEVQDPLSAGGVDDPLDAGRPRAGGRGRCPVGAAGGLSRGDTGRLGAHDPVRPAPRGHGAGLGHLRPAPGRALRAHPAGRRARDNRALHPRRPGWAACRRRAGGPDHDGSVQRSADRRAGARKPCSAPRHGGARSASPGNPRSHRLRPGGRQADQLSDQPRSPDRAHQPTGVREAPGLDNGRQRHGRTPPRAVLPGPRPPRHGQRHLRSPRRRRGSAPGVGAPADAGARHGCPRAHRRRSVRRTAHGLQPRECRDGGGEPARCRAQTPLPVGGSRLRDQH